ncbi:MAG: hypothetical protein AB7S78_11860 [Candidatus Omnitrophota bacterium]
MAQNYDVKTEWEKTKEQLIKFGKEASELVKKGEIELVKITKQSKIQLDATTAGLKKEKLYYQIGKEFVKLRNPASPSPLLKKLLEEYKGIDQEQKSLQTKLKRKNSTDKTKKSTKKKIAKSS